MPAKKKPDDEALSKRAMRQILATENQHGVRFPARFKKWVESREYMAFKQLPDGDMSHIVTIKKMGNDSFGEAVGETLWLDTYDEDAWPDFKPDRYFQIGWNGGGRHRLFDLKDRMKVVEHSHDVGYEDSEIRVVAPSFEAFLKMIEPSPGSN